MICHWVVWCSLSLNREGTSFLENREDFKKGKVFVADLLVIGW